MLRTVIVVLSIVLFFILSLPLFLVEWIVGKISPRARDISMLRIVQGFCRFMLWLAGTKQTVIGLENIPADRPVLYILNHRSLFDVPLTLIHCPDITGYIGKKEIAKVPVLGWWLKALHGYFLDREQVKEALKTILAGIEDLKSGQSIAVFPEGTRGREADERQVLPFHEGTFKLSTKSGALIIPVTINGSSAILEDHFPKIRSSHVIVEYGQPIDPAALDKEQKKFIGKYVREGMVETITRNHQMLTAK